MTCRKFRDAVKTGGKSITRDKSGGCPDFGPDGIRHEGGVTLNRALAWNAGTCRPDAKGEVQMGGPHADKSTEAGHRGGATRSRIREISLAEMTSAQREVHDEIVAGRRGRFGGPFQILICVVRDESDRSLANCHPSSQDAAGGRGALDIYGRGVLRGICFRPGRAIISKPWIENRRPHKPMLVKGQSPHDGCGRTLGRRVSQCWL